MKVTRRTFVKSVGAGAAALAIGGGSAVEGALTAIAAETETLVPGYCRGTIGCMCYCGRFAHVKNGRVVDITGDPAHHYTHGTLCAKGIGEIGNTYGPHRILHPLKRVNGKFVQISWDTAITEISSKLKAIRSEWDGLPLHHMTAEQQQRLARTATPRNSSGDQEWVNYMRMGELFKSSPHYSGCLGCYGNWWRAELATTGFPYPHNQMEDMKNVKLCLNFGTNLAEAFPSMMQHYYDAVAAGMEMVSFEPRKSKMSAKAAEFIPIRPATDGALALGIIREIVINDSIAEPWIYPHLFDYVVKEEWDRFVAEQVMQWTPEKVEETTWVPAAKVVELAQKVHAAGRKVSVLWGSRLSTSTNGFDTSRIMDMLLFAVGAFGIKGGGIHQPKPAGVPSLYTPLASSQQQQWPDKGQPDDPYSWGAGWVPEEQWPEEPIISNARAGFFLGGNGITRASGDQRKYLKHLQDLGCMVYASIEWSEMADLANYVLPMATDLETSGSSSLCGSNHSLQWKDAAVEPIGEAKSDMWILNEVFKRVFGDETFYRECPDCEAQANAIIAATPGTMDEKLDAAWTAIIKPVADAVKAEWEIERFKMPGKDLMTIINEHAAASHASTGHDHGHLYVMRNWELLFREDFKAYGDSIGVDLDNHGRAWVTNIIDQGPKAVYPYWWKFHMLAWPITAGTPAAVDPDNWHPYSGLRIDHVKALPGGVYWPMPWGLHVNADYPNPAWGGKNPNYDPTTTYHGETAFFEKCTECWLTAEQMGKNPIPLLMTPRKRKSPGAPGGDGVPANFVAWDAGKAAIDLKGELWYGAHLPYWHEPTYFGGAELARKDAAFIEDEDFPFITITGKTPQLLNGQTKGGNELLVEICEVPRVWINPATAATLGIADDDTVQITTPKSVEFGPLHMKAKVTELIAPRVAFLAHGSGNVAIDGKLKNEGGENFLGNTDQDHYTHMVGYSHGRAKIVKA